ncbi:hypothetical protein BD770DRAFT_429573 [Pilaira anomala]|nr:hypothetical protein BD770DRAFT_429573 [Pilaira anomala]
MLESLHPFVRLIKKVIEKVSPLEFFLRRQPLLLTPIQTSYMIIQTALSRKSVVFEFPSTTFNTRIDAYWSVVGNGFNSISLRDSRASGKLIISTEFRDTLHTAKAIQQGATVDSIQFLKLHLLKTESIQLIKIDTVKMSTTMTLIGLHSSSKQKHVFKFTPNEIRSMFSYLSIERACSTLDALDDI